MNKQMQSDEETIVFSTNGAGLAGLAGICWTGKKQKKQPNQTTKLKKNNEPIHILYIFH